MQSLINAARRMSKAFLFCRCAFWHWWPSTVSVALALHTSSTFARWSLTSLVGRISVPPNAATCWSPIVPEPNSADGASKLQHQPFGTLCRHTYARHWSVADSLEMGWSPICSQKPTSDPLRTYVFKSVMYLLTYLLTYCQIFHRHGWVAPGLLLDWTRIIDLGISPTLYSCENVWHSISVIFITLCFQSEQVSKI